MSGGGTTSQSTSTVPPQFLQAYQQTMGRANQVASTPYQAYTGNLVAPLTAIQNAGIQGVTNTASSYQPARSAAQSDISASTAPLWSSVAPVNGSTIAQYENPYQSQLIGATEGQIANTDTQQQNQLEGQAGAAGAFGGDRMGVAQGSQLHFLPHLAPAERKSLRTAT
jgi:hypothetical protein